MYFDGFKVNRSVIGTKEGDLQYTYIYKLLLSLSHGHTSTLVYILQCPRAVNFGLPKLENFFHNKMNQCTEI